MSSDSRIQYLRRRRSEKKKGFAFCVGLLALLVSAGCDTANCPTDAEIHK